MSKQQPLISVLIPAYNAERFLAACLDSIVGQTWRNFEVVAVNDGSTDGTSALLHAYAARDSRIRVIDKPNEGVMLTRKRCIDEAAGEWVFFIDSDDCISPDAIGKLYDRSVRDNCDIVSSTVLRVKKGYRSAIGQTPDGVLSGVEFISAILQHRIHIGLLGKLYRRSLMSGLEYYPDISIGEDMLLNIQVAMQPDFSGICFVSDAFYYYMQHDSSLVHRKVSFDYQEHFARVFDSLFATRPDIAASLRSELLRERVMRVHVYIKRSSNPWMGDRPLARAAYQDVRANRRLARQITPAGTATMVTLYRHRCLKPLVVAIATVQRWRNSLTRRIGKTRAK